MSEGWGESWGSAASAGPTPSGDGWGGSREPASATLERPPLLLVLAGTGVAVLGLAVAVIGLVLHQFWPALLAWLLAGPAALGLLAAFVLVEGARRARGWYVDSAAAPWLRRVLVVAALVAVALSAWTVADLVARG